jgi:hypothetical protein
MARRYELKWRTKSDDKWHKAFFAFRGGATGEFSAKCEQEASGEDIEGVELVYLGPDGEREKEPPEQGESVYLGTRRG